MSNSAEQVFLRMRRIPATVRKRIEPALESAAEEMVRLMKSLCPVDAGDLRDSIAWKWGDAPDGSVPLGGVGDRDTLRITVYAGDGDAFYARFVEFGSKAGVRGARSGVHGAKQSKALGRKAYRTHPGTKAQPFFFPAYRALKKKTENRIKRAISRAVKEEFK